jgi:hypothetical protein
MSSECQGPVALQAACRGAAEPLIAATITLLEDSDNRPESIGSRLARVKPPNLNRFLCQTVDRRPHSQRLIPYLITRPPARNPAHRPNPRPPAKRISDAPVLHSEIHAGHGGQAADPVSDRPHHQPARTGSGLNSGFRHLFRAKVTVTNANSPASHLRAPIRALPRRSWHCWVAQK